MEDLASFLSQHEFAVTVLGGAVIVALAIVFGRSVAATASELERQEWRNPAAEWLLLCQRMREAVGSNGPLVFKVVTEMNPYGGEVAVVWEFQGRTDLVVAVRFSSNQTGQMLKLAEKHGSGEWEVPRLSRTGFGAFLDRLEETILKYTSPLSRVR